MKVRRMLWIQRLSRGCQASNSHHNHSLLNNWPIHSHSHFLQNLGPIQFFQRIMATNPQYIICRTEWDSEPVSESSVRHQAKLWPPECSSSWTRNRPSSSKSTEWVWHLTFIIKINAQLTSSNFLRDFLW